MNSSPQQGGNALNASRADSEIPTRLEVSGPSAHTPVISGSGTVANSEVQQIHAKLPSVPGYQVIQLLGRGGMGYVVQARDQQLGRMVAIKLPLPEKMRTPEHRERFLREARAAARLRHPNICPIYEIGEAPDSHGGRDGQPYIALGFIAGDSLNQWAKDRKLTARETAELVAVLAGAVSYAHEHGVIHRDIKPGNVMIDRETGQPMLMDFGLAKDIADDDSELTHDGAIIGTPAYMSPEQAAGEQIRIGPRSDIYGLGALLYYLLCGRAPFEGSFGEILKSVQSADRVSPRKFNRGLHRNLETICLKAMAKDPADRYATAAALAEDLKRFAAGESILARPDGFVRKAWRFTRRHPLTLIAGIAGVLALSVAVLLVQRSSHQRSVVRQSQLVGNLLNQTEWNPARYRTVRAEIETLRRLSPDDAIAAEDQVNHRYRDFVHSLLSRPSLSPDLVDRIREEIAFMTTVDAELATGLTVALESRLRAWFLLFDLTSPFADVAKYFDSRNVRIDNTAIVPLSSAKESQGWLTPLRATSEGNVELMAVFPADALAKTTRLGVAIGINRDTKEGYEFVLTLPRAAAASHVATSQPANVPARSRSAELQIVRNGIVVRRKEIPVPAPPVSIVARRESGRLSLQLNHGTPLVFDDVFPLGFGTAGVFAIIAPDGAPISRITASRQALPTTPSKLERADFLHANGKLQEALDDYRAQEAGAAADVVQESRCKQGLCLLELNRTDEAVQLLSQLASEKGDRWPIVAAGQLWFHLVRDKRLQEAEPIVASLANRYQFEELATLLPAPVREALLKEYRNATEGRNLISFNAEKLAMLERTLEVERLIAGVESFSSQTALLRGYRALAMRQQATHLASRMIGGPEFASIEIADQIWTIEEYCWELRLQGRRQEALDLVNQRLLNREGAVIQKYLPLLVERARCQVAFGRWKEAEEDIRQLLSSVPVGKLLYRHFSAAHLVLGFCRKEAGDDKEAQAVWNKGLYRVWQPEAAKLVEPGQLTIPELPAENHNQFSGLEVVQFLMLGSLTGEISEAETNRIFFWFVNKAGSGDDIRVVQSIVSIMQADIVSTIFRRMCQHPRGSAVARSIALQTVGLTETYQHPMFLCLYEVARQGAFEANLSDDEDAFLWQFATDAYGGFLSGTVTKPQFVALAVTWKKGLTGLFGWDGVSPTLSPGFRSQLAYLMGRRFQRLTLNDDATRLFKAAVKDSTADSLVRKLSQTRLDTK